MTLRDTHLKYGAQLAPDGIPLHYNEIADEYQAGIERAILLDRTHEGRIRIFGKDRFDLLNRMSTNKLMALAKGEGRPTIFTNANARIIDRVVAYNNGDHLLIITEPGQGDAMTTFLQRHIFFNDDAQLENISASTNQFALHGPNADAIMATVTPEASQIDGLGSLNITVDDATIFAARRKAISGTHWALITARETGAQVYEAIMQAGAQHGLRPSGGLTFNTLRIRAGHPARPELNTDYIPLEIGLWDEVNFAKGCYTGQEIIARMESRARLAKTIVALELSEMVKAPADVSHDGRKIGKMTSSAQAPNGDLFAIAVLKMDYVSAGTAVTVGTKAATVGRLLGTQPDFIEQG